MEDHSGGARKVGALKEAHTGTLYIDEIADMPIETQGKVLRVLVEQKFQRLGGGPKVSVDVRIISSTSRDLEREMGDGRFREDLYHRRAAARARPRRAARRHSAVHPVRQGGAVIRLVAAEDRRGRHRGAAGA